MDSPSESSQSRNSNTDFSIDRILSEEPRCNQVEQAPSWLCCTRYRPPKLQKVSNSGCRVRRAGRHARVPFTAAQATALEAAYERAPYLAPPALRALAAALQLRDDRIKIWFQNRRARDRREKCTNIAPPDAVTLPPTDVITLNASIQGNNYLKALMNSSRGEIRQLIPTCTETSINSNNQNFSTPTSLTMSHNIMYRNNISVPQCSYTMSAVSPKSDTEFVEEEMEFSNEDDRAETPVDIESVVDDKYK